MLIDPECAVFRNGAVEEELVLKYATPVPQDRIPPRPATAGAGGVARAGAAAQLQQQQ